MAKIELTYRFDSDNADGELLHRRLVKVSNMACLLFDIHYNLKKQLEWYLESNPDGDIIEEMVRLLTEWYDSNGITEDILS